MSEMSTKFGINRGCKRWWRKRLENSGGPFEKHLPLSAREYRHTCHARLNLVEIGEGIVWQERRHALSTCVDISPTCPLHVSFVWQVWTLEQIYMCRWTFFFHSSRLSILEVVKMVSNKVRVTGFFYFESIDCLYTVDFVRDFWWIFHSVYKWDLHTFWKTSKMSSCHTHAQNQTFPKMYFVYRCMQMFSFLNVIKCHEQKRKNKKEKKRKYKLHWFYKAYMVWDLPTCIQIWQSVTRIWIYPIRI